MEKEQIHPIPFGAHSQSLLACDEGEVVSQLQKELLQLSYERVFQLSLGIFVLQPQKFEHERIFYLEVDSSLYGFSLGLFRSRALEGKG